MKALTICQPHSWFIVADPEELARLNYHNPIPPKRIENRTWPTSYRGPLLIHAGTSRAWLRDWDDIGLPEMVFGAFVGVCDLVDCLTWDDKLPPWAQWHFHRSLQDDHCWWILDNVRRFKKPVPWKGAQQLWNADSIEIQRAIAEAVAIDWKPERAFDEELHKQRAGQPVGGTN